MDTPAISRLITRHGLVSDQVDERELRVILRELASAVARVPGAVVELGCYKGTTSLYVRRILDMVGDGRPFHVYDSFAGLPEKGLQDQSPVGEQFVAGELTVSKKEFVAEFKKAGLLLPSIHKGWFDDLTPDDMPDPIAFAFLDGDYYDSIKTSLRLLEGKLAPGATIVVDDYANEALPGAGRAVNEWANGRALRIQTIASLAVIKTN